MDYEKAPESQGEVKNWDVAPERNPQRIGEKAIFSEAAPEDNAEQLTPGIEIVPVTPETKSDQPIAQLFADSQIYPNGKDISQPTLDAMHTIENTFPSNPNAAYENYRNARKTYVTKDENNPKFANYQSKIYQEAA